MTISLNPKHHYITQQRIWDNHIKGPLTDKRIHEYVLAGRYGVEAQRAARANEKIGRPKLLTKKHRLNELLRKVLA